MAIILPILILLISIVVIYFGLIKVSPLCDLTNPSNRSFDIYYGITPENNYFQEVNSEKDSSPFFSHAIPGNLFSKSSFILVAKRGSGKTKIRKQFVKTKGFAIELYNKHANKILKSFIENVKANNPKMMDHEYIEKFWNETDFEDSIIYLAVDEILNKYTKMKSNFLNIFKNLKNSDMRLQLSTILCIYSVETKFLTLQDFLNNLWLSENWIDKEIQDYPFEVYDTREGRTVLTRNYADMKKYQDSIRVFEKSSTGNNQRGLKMLNNIIEKFNLKYFIPPRNDKLTIITDFFKEYFFITPTIVIDSLDEVSYFFDDKIVNDKALKVFIKTSLKNFILAKAFDGSFDIVYLFPQLETIKVADFIERRDKIPLIHLTWTPNQLKNYADFILNEMNKVHTSHCKTLPDFYELVQHKKFAKLIDQIESPREMNIFIQELIIQLKADSSMNKFVPSQVNVEIALMKAKIRMNKNNS